jgi:ion channel-forming bestrophin family protein
MARKYGTTVYVNAKWRMMLRLKGTVILQIWWQILLVGIYSAIVFLISKYSEWKMGYTLVRSLSLS